MSSMMRASTCTRSRATRVQLRERIRNDNRGAKGKSNPSAKLHRVAKRAEKSVEKRRQLHVSEYSDIAMQRLKLKEHCSTCAASDGKRHVPRYVQAVPASGRTFAIMWRERTAEKNSNRREKVNGESRFSRYSWRHQSFTLRAAAKGFAPPAGIG